MITLTQTAADKVGALLAAQDDPDVELVLRVAVRPGGCSGFSYEMFFDGDVADSDTVAEFGTAAGGKVRVAVDVASGQLLAGATLDYRDGLDQSGFHVSNPNASRACGCGQSFS